MMAEYENDYKAIQVLVHKWNNKEMNSAQTMLDKHVIYPFGETGYRKL